MPLIKYYSIRTCYDGQREFTKSENFERHYPDEYLIANILLKYQYKRFPDTSERKQNIVVLTEPWKGSTCKSSIREGGKNTYDINDLTIKQIKLAEKEQKNTLILVPWLYGYHHPGISIDVHNKIAIYLDPYGTTAHYSEAIALENTLVNMGFKTLTVTTRQQTDAVSCGPILTSSMIKFIDEFMNSGTISVNGFRAPRLNLATDRMLQMYINNTVVSEKARLFVDEIMLAVPSLWKTFLHENNVPDDTSQLVLNAVALQKKAIELLPAKWENTSACKSTVQFITNFQSAITEYVLLSDSQLASKIELLTAHSNQLFDEHGMASDNDWNFESQDLLGMDNKAADVSMSDSSHNIQADKPQMAWAPEEPGVQLLSRHSVFVYPESYGRLIAGSTDNLMKARIILNDYTKGDSAVCRFFTGHWNRHHVAEVHALVRRIYSPANDAITTVEELLKELNHIQLVNSVSSLARRIRYITEYCQYTFDVKEEDTSSYEYF